MPTATPISTHPRACGDPVMNKTGNSTPLASRPSVCKQTHDEDERRIVVATPKTPTVIGRLVRPIHDAGIASNGQGCSKDHPSKSGDDRVEWSAQEVSQL